MLRAVLAGGHDGRPSDQRRRRGRTPAHGRRASGRPTRPSSPCSSGPATTSSSSSPPADGAFDQAAAGRSPRYRRDADADPARRRVRETTTLPLLDPVVRLGCSRSRCAGRSPAAARSPHGPHHRARRRATPWWAPPDRLDPRTLTVLGLLAAASMSSAFVNTLFTQTVNFAADDFGVSDTRRRHRRLGRAGRDHPRPARRRPRRPHRAPPRGHGDGRRRAARHGRRGARPDVPAPRRDPGRRPPARPGPRLPRSPSSPPRRCRATAGPTPSASWRWRAGSAPGSP